VALRRPVSDFYVAGRLVPAMFNGAAIAAGLFPVLAFAGLTIALGGGWDGVSLLALGAGGGLAAIAFLIAPFLRNFGGYTVPDFLAERFNQPGIRTLAVVAVILSAFPALALTLLGLGALATRIFAIDLATGVALGAVLLLACSFVAGMRSASLTQMVQYAVLFAAALAATVLLLGQHGAFVPARDDAGLQALASAGFATFAAEDKLDHFAMLFSVAAGLAALPHLLVRSLVTPSTEGARTSFLWAMLFTGVLCLVGVPPLALLGEAPAATGAVLPVLTFGFAAVAAIAALLALGSGLAVTVANSLSYDLYYKVVQPGAPTERRIFVARAALVAVTALAAWAALTQPETIHATAAGAFSLAASALLPALVLGIWWKRASGEGALAGMLAGLAVCLYYMLAPRYFPFAFYDTSSFLSNATPAEAARYNELRQSFYLATDETARATALASWEEVARAAANWGGIKRDFAAIFAVPIGLLTMIGVSLFTPVPAREVQTLIGALRKPSAG
jgi:cation/acetate symporter